MLDDIRQDDARISQESAEFLSDAGADGDTRAWQLGIGEGVRHLTTRALRGRAAGDPQGQYILTHARGVHAEGSLAGAICLSVRRGNKWFFHHFPTVIFHALLALAFHPHDTIAEGVGFRLESKGRTSFMIALC